MESFPEICLWKLPLRKRVLWEENAGSMEEIDIFVLECFIHYTLHVCVYVDVYIIYIRNFLFSTTAPICLVPILPKNMINNFEWFMYLFRVSLCTYKRTFIVFLLTLYKI